jgi:hypothetical protein
MHEPFRCRSCGETTASATRCPHCHGRSFELAPAPEPRAPREEPAGAVLVSLAAVREERGRTRRD